MWHYISIAIAILATGMGAPYPEELPVITAGCLVGHPDNLLHWWIMLPVCIIAVVLGDCILYGIGRFGGPRLLEYRWVKKHILPPERHAKIERNFHEYGIMILLFARLMPTIRSPIFISAGMMRVPLSRFLLADGLYAIPGVSLLFFLGYMFTDQFLRWFQSVEEYRQLFVLIALGLIVVFLLYRFLRNPITEGDPRIDVPLLGDRIAETLHQHQSADGSPESSARSAIRPPPGD